MYLNRSHHSLILSLRIMAWELAKIDEIGIAVLDYGTKWNGNLECHRQKSDLRSNTNLPTEVMNSRVNSTLLFSLGVNVPSPKTTQCLEHHKAQILCDFPTIWDDCQFSWWQRICGGGLGILQYQSGKSFGECPVSLPFKCWGNIHNMNAKTFDGWRWKVSSVNTFLYTVR